MYRLIALCSTLVLALLTILARPAPAYACSVGPDFNPVAVSELIVGARVKSWKPAASQGSGGSYPIDLSLEVSHVYKGAAPSELVIFDGSSLQRMRDGSLVWVGGSGPCGAFGEEPTGSSVIIGLTRNAEGRYESSLMLVFFRGAALDGEGYQAALARLQARGVNTSSAAQRCFPETGRCISGRFREYWEQNGGLAVFGYPTTPVASTTNRDTGRSHMTQWFERNRFEYHPDKAAPYDVLLGRLGDDRLQLKGVQWQDFPRDAGPARDCLWFVQTQFYVCDQEPGSGFKTYWQTHGLQDPALSSYGRSLALFGLPLTQPRLERNSSGDLVLTQWFERARFEYHPRNQPAYKVLLGRLGAELQPLGDISTIIQGHVAQVSNGREQIIRLNSPSQGIAELVVSSNIRIVFIDGSSASLQDLRAGRQIHAAGTLRDADTMLARQILIGVTVMGTVEQVSRGERSLITLSLPTAAPVDAAVTRSTRLMHPDEQPASLSEIQPGTRLQVYGEYSGGPTLEARMIIVYGVDWRR